MSPSKNLLHRRRLGLAPLEFVMALPILWLIACVIFKSADAYLRLSFTHIQARKDSAIPKASPVHEDSPLPDPSIAQAVFDIPAGTFGLVHQREERRLRLNPIYPSEARIGSAMTTLVGPWDYHSILFPERANTDLPFDEAATRLAKQLPPAILQHGIPSFLSPDSNFLADQGLAVLKDELSSQLLGEYGSMLLNLKDLRKNLAKALTTETGDLLKLLKNPADLAKAITLLQELKDFGDNIDYFRDRLSKIGKDFPRDDF